MLKQIWTDRTETAANLQRYISCIFSYAQATGKYTGGNPAIRRDGLEHFLPSPAKIRLVEHHAAIDQKDLPALIADLDSRMSIVAKAIIFGTLTAARANEFVMAEWSEVDFSETRKMMLTILNRDRLSRVHFTISDSASFSTAIPLTSSSPSTRRSILSERSRRHWAYSSLKDFPESVEARSV